MAERRLIVEIVGDSKSLERALGRSSKATDKFGKDVSQAGRGVVAVSGLFSGLGRQVAFASGAFLGAAGLTSVMKQSISTASNLAEQQNKVNAIFGESGRTLTQWARTTATSIGIANDQALEAAGVFGNLFNTVGLAPQKNAQLSRSLVKLAADLASFNNASPEDALDALRSGLIGEAEPLRRFGVLLSESRVQQEAMRESGVKSAANLTNQQRLLARYALILRDSSAAQGDFSRTSDGLANSQRSLSAEIRDLEASIGKALLPTVRHVTQELRDWLKNPENQKKVQDATEKTTRTLDRLGDRAHNVKGNFDILLHGVESVDHAFQAAGKAAKTFFLTVDSGLRRQPTGEDVRLRGFADALARTVTGEDARLRGAGAVNTAGRVQQATPNAGRLGLTARFAKTELALTLAERTRTQRDDRAALKAQEDLLRQMIASRKKAFKDKTSLNNQLTQVINRIQAIDDAAAQKRVDAAQAAAAKAKEAAAKERAARKKAHDAAVRAAKKSRDEALQESRELHDQAEKLRDLIQTQRDRIGDLFSGPIFNPTEAQQKRALGAPVLGSNARQLVADLRAQINQFKSLERDLQTLARRGAPPQLLAELRNQGLAAAPQIHALATAGGGTFSQFKQLFIQRERLAVQAAKQERPININLNVFVEPITGKVKVVRTTPHGQTRGRNPGVPTSIGSFVNP